MFFTNQITRLNWVGVTREKEPVRPIRIQRVAKADGEHNLISTERFPASIREREAATIIPPREDRRKRARLERESDGLFSFFRRDLSSFYSSGAREASSADNDSDNSAIVGLDDAPIEYTEREFRRVTAHGMNDHANDLLVRVARTAAATANVVFFPGDVQDDQATMSSGVYAEFAAYSYEHSAELLADKFGQDANVWVVRPSRFQFGMYTCFDHFVETNRFGAATKYSSSGSAVEQLVSLMEDARSQLEEHDVNVSTLLPVHLVGFSKGGVVLNQIATEIASRWHPASLDPESGHNSSHSAAAADDDDDGSDHDMATAEPTRFHQFAALISSIHWLDSGNGSKEGAVPTDDQTLAGLSAFRSLQLTVHVTPYQFDAKDRPWIKKEIVRFINGMKRNGVVVRLQRYLDEEESTLSAHFQILRDFQLSIANVKTGQRTHSPEVTVQPYPIQTHA